MSYFEALSALSKVSFKVVFIYLEATDKLKAGQNSRGYSIFIYDSADCSSLQNKLTLYVRNSAGELRIFNKQNGALASSSGGDLRSTSVAGFLSTAAADEELATSITGKAITLEEDSGKVLGCWLHP